MAGSLDLKDSELSDLFDLYPDIRFELAEDSAPACEHFSSPCSNTTDHQTPSSKNDNSTAHTTPNWPRIRGADHSHLPSLNLFFDNLESADLPLPARHGFETLARKMTVLGSLLVPQNGDYYEGYIDSNKPKIQSHARSMLIQLQYSNDKVKDEIDNIDFVQTRAPFTVEPSMDDLWCNYRQRARLIAQYISLPCRTERNILEEATHIFDAYIYHPFLELWSMGEMDFELEDVINELYNALMTLLCNYNRWTKDMKKLKEHQMQPLLMRIRKTPEVTREIAEVEFVKAMAKSSIGSPEGPGMQPADERTIQELNLSTSRRHAPIPRRARSRYRREHTV